MNGTKAKCGHYVIAVGAPGSAARERCEQSPCDDCNFSAAMRCRSKDCENMRPMGFDHCDKCYQEEKDAMAALLRSHPKHGQRAISINDCLRSRQVPKALKVAWETIYTRNYGK